MIYRIVEIETGKSIEDTTEQSLKKLRVSLRYLNVGSILTNEKVEYAIACYLPSEAFVTVGKAMLPTPIKELSTEERQIFWDYYTKHSSYKIPCSEFNNSKVPRRLP